ncbi:hypothetical protein BFP97_05410 [Roseivirga sp. 4D4]|uniref:VOC family protein n=1 Tax=Roseivirga sp. 4D4 TaxID=1889784 RepID=UPI0008537DF6|nr:VOC family protein [Roseivirga sp. 4D4]OEK00981.1 hypothetical protein BFP97_05410 [Roseivirga sp. 4D4]
MQLIPYLTFPGTCEQAMEFYATCLGGTIVTKTTYNDSPIDVPNEVSGRIFNSELQSGNLRIKASDDLPNHPMTPGSGISLYILIDDIDKCHSLFKDLSQNGKTLFPMKDGFGMLKDQFGTQWMIVLNKH